MIREEEDGGEMNGEREEGWREGGRGRGDVFVSMYVGKKRVSGRFV